MKTEYHIVIVGSGIGGLSAARTLAGCGLDILMIDECIMSGGQLLRKTEKLIAAKFDPDVTKKKGFSLIQIVENSDQHIDRINQAQVLGIFEGKTLLVHTGTSKGSKNSEQIVEIRAEFIILATGARERYLPFKGWTLPGVMSLGSAQILIKSHGILPAQMALVAGSSPLMMVLASELLKNGGTIAAMLNENPFSKNLKFFPLIRHHWPKLVEGAVYSAQLMWNRVLMVNRTRVLEARGKNQFESLIAARTTADGHIIAGTEQEYRAGALTIGHGFVPNIELAVQAGCDTEYLQAGGGWIVTVDKNLETTLDSVYAVGEITGVAGGKKSIVQGEIAAISILKKMGKLPREAEDSKRMEPLYSRNRQQMEYAAFLNNLCQVPLAAYQQIPDETLICRCENISMGEIKKAITLGFTTSGGIKKATRCGMGMCQGRICGAVITDIIMALTQKKPEEIGSSRLRAPVKNVAIDSFLD
jgi:NADPH-dependent 2,4-dienoyl-CoA reductase/sulfur reductase-like enzyme